MVNLALGFLSVPLEIDSRAIMTIPIYGHIYGNVVAFMVERDLKAMGSVTLADHPIISPLDLGPTDLWHHVVSTVCCTPLAMHRENT